MNGNVSYFSLSHSFTLVEKMKMTKHKKCSSSFSSLVCILLMASNIIQGYPFDYSISSFYSPSQHDFGLLSREGKHIIPIEEQFKRGQPPMSLPSRRMRDGLCRSIITPACQNYIKVLGFT